ncbi:hypothetical protein ANO11243_071800 [Dothideomycetidae sp. 11243]|nr:hypothetical protein ANO11243_071800 [fungal sp. No.11243]
MALPVVSKLEQCSDYTLTLAPYIYQFAELPKRLLTVTSFERLEEVYITTNPVVSALALSIVVGQIAFVVSTINKNYSQIDRVWSILPAVYNCHYWYYGYLTGIRSQRMDIMAVFTLCWAARLTFNYWRKGGYEIGSEDYRWNLVKSWFSEPVWVGFNYVVVSLFQSFLLAMVTTPSYILLLASRINPSLGGDDAAFMQILGMLLMLEYSSDNQQWEFQEAKKEYQRTAKVPEGHERADLDRGFITTGLWGYSRHPNFAAEQGIWVALYQWACFQSGSLMNWTFVGVMFYLFIFQASTPITEYMSSKKYPEYKLYKERVGRFIPKLGSPSFKSSLEKEKKLNEPKAVNTTEKTKQSKKLR